MVTQRLMPPASGLAPSIKVNGRDYTCALGSTVDVPDCDGAVMMANGWTEAAGGGGVGVTAARPATPLRGAEFHDSTLGKNIRFDGKIWRDPTSGASI